MDQIWVWYDVGGLLHRLQQLDESTRHDRQADRQLSLVVIVDLTIQRCGKPAFEKRLVVRLLLVGQTLRLAYTVDLMVLGPTCQGSGDWRMDPS